MSEKQNTFSLLDKQLYEMDELDENQDEIENEEITEEQVQRLAISDFDQKLEVQRRKKILFDQSELQSFDKLVA